MSDRLRVPKSEKQVNADGAGDASKLTRKSSTVIMDLKLKVSQLFRCELKDEHEVRGALDINDYRRNTNFVPFLFRACFNISSMTMTFRGQTSLQN